MTEEAQRDQDTRDIASFIAEIIRRMGAAYGDAEAWRRDYTAAVEIMNRASRRLQRATLDR